MATSTFALSAALGFVYYLRQRQVCGARGMLEGPPLPHETHVRTYSPPRNWGETLYLFKEAVRWGATQGAGCSCMAGCWQNAMECGQPCKQCAACKQLLGGQSDCIWGGGGHAAPAALQGHTPHAHAQPPRASMPQRVLPPVALAVTPATLSGLCTWKRWAAGMPSTSFLGWLTSRSATTHRVRGPAGCAGRAVGGGAGWAGTDAAWAQHWRCGQLQYERRKGAARAAGGLGVVGQGLHRCMHDGQQLQPIRRRRTDCQPVTYLLTSLPPHCAPHHPTPWPGEYPAADIAAQASPIHPPGNPRDRAALAQQLHALRRYMLLCQGLRHPTPEQQLKHWQDHAGIGEGVT